MLSLYAKPNYFVEVDGIRYPVDFSFNRVLANMDLSQNSEISDVTKARYHLMNYLRLSKEELKELGWNFLQQREVYLAITMKLFSQELEKTVNNQNKNDDKSVYSFSEDADFIFSSFLKDYNINLIEQRNKMHWNEFKALFVSLSSDTKMSEVILIRQWTKGEHDTDEYCESMRKLQKNYALKQSQQEYELIELERQKMASMSPDERIEYAKRMAKKIEEGG